MSTVTYAGKIKPEFFSKVNESFKRYKEHKKALDRRIIENNRWFKSRYNSNKIEIDEPATPYIFNVIANKHAHVMDNYPEPNVLEKERNATERRQKCSQRFCRFSSTSADSSARTAVHGGISSKTERRVTEYFIIPFYVITAAAST